jgi:DNA-binding MarR family transcriptional regulator
MASSKKKFISYCQEFLVTEFKKRKKRNPAYSVRAFARDIGLSKTSVSAVLNGLRRLSKANIEILSSTLNLNSETLKCFKDDIGNAPSEEGLAPTNEWYFMAILNLANVPENKFCAKWVAERLGIPHEIAEQTLKKLLVLGLIEEKNGRFDRLIMPLEELFKDEDQ